MDARIARVGGACVISLLSVVGLARASEPDLRLVTAAAQQDREAVRAWLKKGVDVNSSRADGVTALLWAAQWDDLAMADMLLRAGGHANAADDHGVTPLMRACANASVAMVEKLLGAGANANGTQTSGLTPLMTAARTGNVNVVKTLLAHGANINAATTESDQTPLLWAVAEGHRDVARVLIEGGAGVHVSSRKGFTPLLFAARNGDIDMATVLLAAGAGVNEPGADGTQALPFAIVSGQDRFAQFLLERGADPNGTMAGIGALHAAAGDVGMWLRDWNRVHGSRDAVHVGPSRRLPIVKALLARGANPNARITTSTVVLDFLIKHRGGAFEAFAVGTGDLRGATPLWVAAASASGGGQFGEVTAPRVESSAEIIQVLLAAGADHRVTTDDGTTPLMAAAGMGFRTYQPRKPRGDRSPSAEAAVKTLVEAGADVNAVNEADFTPLHGAAFRGLNEVVQYLVDHGANINARDFKGRTPFRIAEGAKQSYQFQDWPETAELFRQLGANTKLGIPGNLAERGRDVGADAANHP